MKLINLLPKTRQQLLQQEAVLGSLRRGIWYSILSFVFVIAVQFGVKLYLDNQARIIRNSVAQLQNQVDRSDNGKLKIQIGQINNLIADYKNLAFSQPKWYKVIIAFAALPPNQVTVNSLNIDFEKKSVIITGTAMNRDLVDQLHYNILADDKEFYGIDYPLENVADAVNPRFHFTFYIRDSLLK